MWLASLGMILLPHGILAGAIMLLLVACAGPEAPAKRTQPMDPLAVAGGELWQKRCGVCHGLENDRLGPRHRGVYGRTAGSVPGFDYTPGLAAMGIVWTEETLDRWLSDPYAMVPETTMEYALKDAGERKAVIAYLKTLTP